MPGRKPTKNEIAKMAVMAAEGFSNRAIGEELGRSHVTVTKYLSSEVFTDPDIAEKIEKLQKAEIDDLTLLTGKLRGHLHMLVDRGKMRPIETVAALDRTFQQRRLLEGKSTQHHMVLTK